MTIQEKEDYKLYIEYLYNQWIEKEEQRGISYGEISYIDSLTIRELKEIEKELEKELNYE